MLLDKLEESRFIFPDFLSNSLFFPGEERLLFLCYLQVLVL